MKQNYLSLFIFLLLPLLTFSQDVAETLYKKIDPGTASSIQVDLQYPVEIVYWNRNIIRVDTNVELLNPKANLKILKGIIYGGRYQIVAKRGESNIKIIAPQINYSLNFMGGEMQEAIQHKVFLPKRLEYQETVANTLAESSPVSKFK